MQGEERIDCPLYPVPEFGWSYAPLRIASDDLTAFASRLMRGCDEWAQMHFEFQARANDGIIGLAWGTAAAVESRCSAPAERLDEIEQQLERGPQSS